MTSDTIKGRETRDLKRASKAPTFGENTRKAPVTTQIIIPTEGRYTRYSSISIAIGIMLDSTESVIKNHSMPKPIKRKAGVTFAFFTRYTPSPKSAERNRND